MALTKADDGGGFLCDSCHRRRAIVFEYVSAPGEKETERGLCAACSYENQPVDFDDARKQIEELTKRTDEISEYDRVWFAEMLIGCAVDNGQELPSDLKAFAERHRQRSPNEEL